MSLRTSLLALSLLLCLGTVLPAQDLSTGTHYYLVENLDQPGVDRRGQAGTLGTAFSQLILATNTRYRIWFLSAETRKIGRVEITTGGPGSTTSLPRIFMRTHSRIDDDQDGLANIAERIVGTDVANPDTDGDGVPDGAELTLGTDPGDGIVLGPGIRDSAALPGPAYDVAVDGDLMVVAHDTGVTGFNIFGGLSPTSVFQIDGVPARTIACSRGYVIAGSGADGAVVIDARDPDAAAVVRSLPVSEFGGRNVRQLAAIGNYGYVMTNDSRIFSIDLRSGTVLDELSLGATGIELQDLEVDGDFLYAGRQDLIHIVDPDPTHLEQIGLFDEGDLTTFNDIRRLEIANGRAYLLSAQQMRIGEVGDPENPLLYTRTDSGDVSCCIWDIVVDAQGVALIAKGTNSVFPTNSDIFLYDVSDPTLWNTYTGMNFGTPGGVRRIELANALAYLADDTGGVQILSYRDADTAGLAPMVSLDLGFDPAGVATGSEVRVTALATDDVAVRDVRFEIAGELVTVSTFPFTTMIPVPPLSMGSFTVRAVAFDTAGNLADSETVVATILPDNTPPSVDGFRPRGFAIGDVTDVLVLFNEEMDPATLDPGSVSITAAGLDGAFGTGDDAIVTGTTVGYTPTVYTATITTPEPLALGRHRVTVAPDVTDVSGLPVSVEVRGYFTVYADTDVDGDGEPDGTLDTDGDGLLNAFEALLGLDPLVADYVPGTDTDEDGLDDLSDLLQGLDPTVGDFDGDGILDGEEIDADSDPFDGSLIPVNFLWSDLGVYQNDIDIQFGWSDLGLYQNDIDIQFGWSVVSARNDASPAATTGALRPENVTSVENQTP